MSIEDIILRPPAAEEFPDLWRSLTDVFGDALHDSDRDIEQTVFEPERFLIALDGEEIVGTGGIFTREVTIPGAVVPVAGVTYISVAPTHRRRGLLTRIMQRQLTELHEQGAEPVAALWASEGAIYGRFGYGHAAPRAIYTGHTRDLAFRAGVDLGTGRVRRLPEDKARPHIQTVYDAVRHTTLGHLDRTEAWWDYRHYDPEHHRDGATALRFVVHEEADGQVTGWTAYRVKAEWERNGPNGMVQILDLSATHPAAYAALWRFLLDLDLVRQMRRRMGPVDEPLRHLLANPPALTTEIGDGLWIRLVDLDRALAARRYPTDIDVVLDVTDRLCPWNAGRWRLTGGSDGASCEPTTDAADLALSATELGAAYLGGTRLTALAAAGWVRELTPGAVHRVSTAFGWPTAPWCTEVF
ncbi:GNAT family N-acetyltransferase [soil metagenome]